MFLFYALTNKRTLIRAATSMMATFEPWLGFMSFNLAAKSAEKLAMTICVELADVSAVPPDVATFKV